MFRTGGTSPIGSSLKDGDWRRVGADRLAALSVRWLGIEVHAAREVVVDAVENDRRLALEVAGEEQPRAAVREPDLRDPGPERLDRKDDLGVEHVAVEAEVPGDIGARHVEEVEGLDLGHVR